MKIAQCKTNGESVHHSIVNHEKQSFFSGQTHNTESFFSPVTIQPKLKIGAPDDQYERQADRVAEDVVSSPTPVIQQESMEEEEETLQLKCNECEKEEEIQMKSDTGQSAGTAISAISQKIQNAGGGSHLSESVNSEMSQKMGADFSDVNIHTGPEASQLNHSLGARAFTHGADVFFNSGEYNPGSREGKRLLAHELTHVVQQGNEKKLVQRDGDGEQEPVTQLSGHYWSTERFENGHRKRTDLFINVNQLTLTGNFRSFIDQGNGYDIEDSGDVYGERLDQHLPVRYRVIINGETWDFDFNRRMRGGLNELIEGGRRVPIYAMNMAGQSMEFRRVGSTPPVTSQEVANAPPNEASALESERQEGLTPDMIVSLRNNADQLVEVMRRYPHAGIGNQLNGAYLQIADQYNGILSQYSGNLRLRAESYLLERLRRVEIQFMGERVRADRVVQTSLGFQSIQEDGETGVTGGVPYRYEITFRGVRGQGRAIVGLQGASGSVEVKAYRASAIESFEEIAWQQFYHFVEMRVSAAAGGGLSGGVYWKTFDAVSPGEWTQEDFGNAEIYIFGLSGPTAQAGAEAGPLSANLASCTVYQFEGVSLESGNKTLELSADEKSFECQSDLTSAGGGVNTDLEQNNDTNRRNRREGGVEMGVEGSLGQLEGGMGHIESLPGREYSDENQQLPEAQDRTRTVEVIPPVGRSGFDVGSSDLERNMQVDISRQLASVQHLIRDESIPIRVIGHASSLWRGRESDAVQGNMALSMRRAEEVESLIRRIYELSEDRMIDIVGMGDQEHRNNGGTVETDDPGYRRVDVVIQGHRTIPIFY